MRSGTVHEMLRLAVALAARLPHVLVATAGGSGRPHLAAARRMTPRDPGVVALEEWFCPETMENLYENPHLSLVVWDPAEDAGYQLAGRLRAVEDLSMLDGYVPRAEEEGAVPQVESRLIVEIDEVSPFRRGAHRDVPAIRPPAERLP